jgi:hypothetical protein
MGQKQSVKILEVEYIIQDGFNSNDDDSLITPLKRKDRAINTSITYFHYLLLTGGIKKRHVSEKFESSWSTYVGFDPVLRYILTSDTDIDVLIGFLDYPFIQYKLIPSGRNFESILEPIMKAANSTRNHFSLVKFARKLNETQPHIKADVIHSDTKGYVSIASSLSTTMLLRSFYYFYPGVEDFSERNDTISSTINDTDYYISSHGSVTSSYFMLPFNVSVIMLASTGDVSTVYRSSKTYTGTKDTLVNTMKMLEYSGALSLYEGGDLIEDVLLSFNADFFVGIKLVKDADSEVVDKFEDDLNILGDDRELTLHDIIGRLKGRDGSSHSSLDLKSVNFRLILASCRVRQRDDGGFKQICETVSTIKHKTRWGQVCNPRVDRRMTHGKPSLAGELVNLGDDIEFAIECIKTYKGPGHVSDEWWVVRSHTVPDCIKTLEHIMNLYVKGELIYFSSMKFIYMIISSYEDKS